MNVVDRLNKALKRKEWSVYRLAKESGITESTLYSIFSGKALPTIDTLQIICDHLGLSLAELFANNEDHILYSKEQLRLIELWKTLTVEQQKVVLGVINQFSSDNQKE